MADKCTNISIEDHLSIGELFGEFGGESSKYEIAKAAIFDLISQGRVAEAMKLNSLGYLSLSELDLLEKETLTFMEELDSNSGGGDVELLKVSFSTRRAAIEHSAMASTEHVPILGNNESTFEFAGKKLSEFEIPLGSKSITEDLLTFNEIFFTDRLEFIPEFTAIIGADVRNLMYGAQLFPGETIEDLAGPSTFISATKYREFLAGLEAKVGDIADKTHEELTKAFIDGDMKTKSSFYAYVALHNIELLLDTLFTGAVFSQETDMKHTPKDNKRIKKVKGISVLKEFAGDMKSAMTEVPRDMEFDVQDPAYSLDELKETVATISTDKQGNNVETIEGQFIVMKNVPRNFTVKKWNAMNPSYQLDTTEVIPIIRKNDVFKYVNGNLVRVSPPYELTYNMTDKHKQGHEEDFNSLNNDAEFMKFMIKSTPRYNEINDELYQDTARPFFAESEFYALANIISTIPDKSFPGIREFLEEQILSNENVNTKLAILYRSMYHTYFSPEVYSFIPIGSEESIEMAPLGEIAAIKNYKEGDAVGHDIISAMVQFFSKQSVGRINVNDGEITEVGTSGNNILNIQLPPTISNAIFEFEGKLVPEIARKLNFLYNNEEINITLRAGRSNNSIVKLHKHPETGALVIDTAGVSLKTVKGATEILTALKLPPKFTDPRFVNKFFAGSTSATDTLKSNLADFIGKIMVVGAIQDVNKTAGALSKGNEATKNIITTLAAKNIYAFLRTSIDAISNVYEDVHGITAQVQDVTADGNLAAKYTNLDRETDFITMWERGRKPYSRFGVDTIKSDDDILDYFDLDNNSVIKSYKERVLKDSMMEKGEVVSNQEMTLQQRSKHLVEHMFFNKLNSSYEKNHFYTQPMVYSDRSSIYMHKFELDAKLLFLKKDALGRADDNSYLDPTTKPTFFGTLKQNYIKTYRNKYDTMQWNVVSAWTDFLLGAEAGSLITDPIKLVAARNLGYKLASMTRETMRGKNQLRALIQEFIALEIPVNTALKSPQLTKGISVAAADLNGKLIAIPTATASLMVEFLQSDTNAANFVNDNMANTVNTFKSKELKFDTFSDGAKAHVKKFFGRNVSFDEALKFYHLTTAPISDGMIDTLMSPDTEFSKNSMATELILKRGGKLTPNNWNKYLAERTQNFIKQSKRVQSMGSKGIRPRLLRSFGEFNSNLPKEDLMLGMSSTQTALVTNAPPEHRISAAYHSGVFTTLNGAQAVDGSPMITVGGVIVPLKFDAGDLSIDMDKISADLFSNEDFSTRVASALQQIKQLNLHVDLANAPLINASNPDLTEFQSRVNYQKVASKILNDIGEKGLGLEYDSKNILIDEDLVSGPLNLLGALGMRNSQAQDSLDAVQWAHPLYFIKLSASLGNQFSSFSTDGSAVKDLTQTIDPKTGRLILQKKSTQNMFSNEILRSVGNSKLHNMFKIMNTAQTFPPLDIQVPPVDSDGNVIEGPMVTAQFENMQQLWEYFGSYFNDASWNRVGEVIANYPQIRNEYVEKIGFTSGQKTGHSSVNDAKIIFDPKATAADVVVSSVRNDAHIVMLQKFHDYDTSEAADHKSTIAIPSQFLSAMAFEGRTPREALQTIEGAAGLTFSRLDKFYMGMAKAIRQDDNTEFRELEKPLFSAKFEGKKFSELDYSEIDSQAIKEFDIVLNNNPSFKKKLYTKLAIEKILASIDSAADTEILMRLMDQESEDISFNSLLLRKKATTTVRSSAYNDNVKTTLPGVIAVTSPADFVTSIYMTPIGRLSRMDAIMYALTEEPTLTKSVEVALFPAGLPVKDTVLPTDKVEIKLKNGETIIDFAGKAGKYENAVEVKYAVLSSRNKSIFNNTLIEEFSLDNRHWNESDFFKSKTDGKIYPVFYALEKFKHLNLEELYNEFELYTDIDKDLNWYKYAVKNAAGETIPLEATEEYKRNYILNKDPNLYNELYIEDEANYIRTNTKTNKGKIQLKLDTRKYYLKERGRLRKMIESADMQVTLPEVYTPNFSMAAFDLTEDDTLTSIVGFNSDKTAQIKKATKYFDTQIRENPSKFLVKNIGTLTVENYMENMKRFKKLAMRETEPGKRRVYKEVAQLMQDQRKGLDSLKVEFDDARAANITEVVNDYIKSRNFNSVKGSPSLIAVASSKRAKSFVEALEVMPPRIPGQGKQSGFLAKIKGFVHSNKNAIYSPREAYANTGQDNDIDTNNVITRAIDSNGYQYEYKNYLFSYDAEGKAIKDGNGSIISKQGVNPMLEKELKTIEKNIRELASDLKGDPDTEMTPQEIDNLVFNKLRQKRDQFEKSIQNYIIDKMKAVMSNPVNMVEMETPISMDTLKAITDIISDNKDTKEYNYTTHGVNSFNSAWIPILEELNMQGKVGIADYANGQRTYSGILSVQESIGRPLQVGRGWRRPDAASTKSLLFTDASGNLPDTVGLTIAIPSTTGTKFITRDTFANVDVNKAKHKDMTAEDAEVIAEQLQIIEEEKVDYLGNIQAWETLSQLLSAATDNAKELILGQIKANSDTNGIIATMIILGFEFEDVYSFLTQPALTSVFTALEENKNKFESTGLKGVLGAKSKLSSAEKDLKDLLSVTDSMNEFRRVLTMAQNNRIETHDLYKVLEPIYVRSGLTPADVVNGETKYTDKEIYPEEAEQKDGDEKVIKKKIAAKIFNPLFYIHNHTQANSLLKSAIVAEQMVSGISSIDAVLKTTIIAHANKEGKIPDTESYDNYNILINDLIIERYLYNKKAYLPLPADNAKGRTLEFDLSDPDLRAELVYSIGDSVSAMRDSLDKANKASKTNKTSAVLNAIQIQSSRSKRDKKIITIPFLMDASDIETTMLQASVKELSTLNKTQARELAALKDALFYASLIQTKGKSSRNSIISLFPEQYLKFSEEIAEYKLLEETKVNDVLINDSVAGNFMLSLIAQKSLPVHKIGQKGKSFNYNPDEEGYEGMDQGMMDEGVDDENTDEGMIEEMDEDGFTGNPTTTIVEDDFLSKRLIIDKEISENELFKINHAELLTDVYFNVSLSTDIEALKNIPVKLIRRNAQETLSVDTLTTRAFDEIEGIDKDKLRGISMAGYDIGLEVIISKDITTNKQEMGRVLAYLGSGEYAVLNSEGNVVILTDSLLSANNPTKIFFGHNFREGTFKETGKTKGRSWAKGITTNAKTVNGLEISTKNSVINVRSESGKVVNYNNKDLHKDVINYIFEDKTFNGDASLMETLLRESINAVDAQEAIGFVPGTDEDILWYAKHEGVSKIFKDKELVDTTWGKDPGDITNYVDTHLSTFAHTYLVDRNISKSPDRHEIDSAMLKFKAIFSNAKNTRASIRNKNISNTVVDSLNIRAKNYVPVGMQFTSKDIDYIRNKFITPKNC